MNIQDAKKALLKGHELTHLDLKFKVSPKGEKTEQYFNETFAGKEFDEGWSISYKNKGVQKRYDEIRKLKIDLGVANATIENKNLEVAEKDIDLKKSFLEAKQLVQECQAMEFQKNHFKESAARLGEKLAEHSVKYDKLWKKTYGFILLSIISAIVIIIETSIIYYK